MATTTTTESIIANADHHARLSRSLFQLQDVPSDLKQQASHINELKNQLAEGEKMLEDLIKHTKKERKEHEGLRDSKARRFAAKLRGKAEIFEANQVREEQEYVEALQKEMAQRNSNAKLHQLLVDARAVSEGLTEKGKEYEALSAEMELLYDRVFGGPSESFPDEDRLEYQFHEAAKEHGDVQSQLNIENQAAGLLSQAVVQMNDCCASVKDTLEYDGYDMAIVGPSSESLYQRRTMNRATDQASQAQKLVDQACKVNPVVQSVGRVSISTGNYMKELFSNDIFFSNVSFKEKVKTIQTEVLMANTRLRRERDAALKRAKGLEDDMLRSSERLAKLRTDLYQLRKALFERIVSETSKPPDYSTS